MTDYINQAMYDIMTIHESLVNTGLAQNGILKEEIERYQDRLSVVVHTNEDVKYETWSLDKKPIFSIITIFDTKNGKVDQSLKMEGKNDD